MVRGCAFWLAIILAACSSVPAATPRAGKPLPPIDLSIDARPLGGRQVELTLHATPLTAGAALVLELRAPVGVHVASDTASRAGFAATEAHTSRTLAVRALVDEDAGGDVVGAAHLTLPGGLVVNRAVHVHVGAPTAALAPAPARTIVLPSGDRVAEVRP